MSTNKKKIRINKGRLLLVAIVVILIVMIALSAGNVIKLKAEQSALERKQQELTSQKEELTQELKDSGSTAYIEEQARKQLKLIKPGEILYILKDKDSTSTGK